MSKSDFIHEDKETTRQPKEFCMIIAANGSIATTEETTVYVKDLDMFIKVQSLEDSLAVLSLGRIMRRTRVFLRLEGRRFTHVSQTWQNHQLQLGKSCTDGRTWSY